MTPGPIHTYTVTLRYTEGHHDTPKKITLSEIQADTPEEAAWMAKVQLRQAHMGGEIHVFELGVKEESGSPG